MTASGGGGTAGGGDGSVGETVDAGAGLDETLDAGAVAARATVPGKPRARGSGGAAPGSSSSRSGAGVRAGSGSGSRTAPGATLREQRQRAIESPEQDLSELPEVDPDSYVHGYEVARGGMGRIVAARDRRLRRVVAIKELIHHTADRAARFEREALITARLQHPAIVNLHEAGRWPGGQPFYAMKLVSGRSLGEVVSEPLAQRQRMGLLPNLLQMTEAIGYAHQQRIIHRDLKPSNVLIGELGETVVIDWGLAKDLLASDAGDAPDAAAGDGTPLAIQPTLEASPRDRAPASGGAGAAGSAGSSAARTPPAGSRTSSGSSDLTMAGSIMGTPAYMPPEQAAGREVDERADVYALGAILYHVLGGSEPYHGVTSDEILAEVVARPPRPIAELAPALPTDLGTIIEKAMAREASDRYPTAVELAEDLRRFQTGQLVAAHRYSRRELLWRFVGRHRGPLVVAAAALAVVAVIATVSVRRIISERDRAESAGRAAARRADDLALSQARSLVDRDPRAALGLLVSVPPDAPPAVWRAAHLIATDARLRGIPAVLHGHTRPVHSVELSRDGRRMVSADKQHIRVWNLEDGTSRELANQPSGISMMVLSPDGARVATTSIDGVVRVWSVRGGPALELRGHDGLVVGATFLDDSEHLLTTGYDGTVRLWDLASGKGRVITRQTNTMSAVAMQVTLAAASGDGHLVASTSDDGRIILSPLRSDGTPDGAPRALEGPSHRVVALDVSRDGTHVAAGGAHGELWLWDVASGKGQKLVGHDGTVSMVTFSRDGARLASASDDQTIRLWDVATGEDQVLRGHQDAVDGIMFSDSGDVLMSMGDDRTIRLWNTAGHTAGLSQVLVGYEHGGPDMSDDGRWVASPSGNDVLMWRVGGAGKSLRGHKGEALAVAYSPTGDALASAGEDWTVRVWPRGRGRDSAKARVLRGHQAAVDQVVFSPDGRLLASVDRVHHVWLWRIGGPRAAAGRRLTGLGFGELSFSPNGRVLAAPTTRGAVRLWDTRSGETRILPGPETGWVGEVAFSPDGRLLAAGASDKKIRVWDFADGSMRVLTGHGDAVRHVRFSGSRRLMSSDLAGSIREWNLGGPSGQPPAGRELVRVAGTLGALAVAPAGNLVAWTDDQGAVFLWQRRTGAVRELDHQQRQVNQVSFSQDGRTLLAWQEGSPRMGTSNGDVVLAWDTASGLVMVLESWGRLVAEAQLSPKGLELATAESDGSIRLRPFDLPYRPDRLLGWLREAADVRAASPAR